MHIVNLILTVRLSFIFVLSMPVVSKLWSAGNDWCTCLAFLLRNSFCFYSIWIFILNGD